MPPTPAQTNLGYHNMWNAAVVRDGRKTAAEAIAKRILQNRNIYERVQVLTGVPWPMVGAIHNRESSLSFKGHLHNGDPLSARTVQVPKGRPRAGTPPFTWGASAQDALTMPPHSLDAVREWSIERALYEMEKYNGWGYLGRGNSPYLWSWTSLYSGGKFVADHAYSATAQDAQAGCVAVLKALFALAPDAANAFGPRQPEPPKEVLDKGDETTKRAKKAAKGGAIGGLAGAGAEGTQKSGTLKAYDFPKAFTYGCMAVGVAVFVVAVVMIVRKRMLIVQKWGG